MSKLRLAQTVLPIEGVHIGTKFYVSYRNEDGGWSMVASIRELEEAGLEPISWPIIHRVWNREYEFVEPVED